VTEAKAPIAELRKRIEKDEDGRFLAICLGLQGCYTEGETEAEARRLIEDAIRLHVEDPQCLSRTYGMLAADSEEADVEKFFAIQAEALPY
jgi:predicted RNase H-like HicB family nuclease